MFLVTFDLSAVNSANVLGGVRTGGCTRPTRRDLHLAQPLRDLAVPLRVRLFWVNT